MFNCNWNFMLEKSLERVRTDVAKRYEVRVTQYPAVLYTSGFKLVGHYRTYKRFYGQRVSY